MLLSNVLVNLIAGEKVVSFVERGMNCYAYFAKPIIAEKNSSDLAVTL